MPVPMSRPVRSALSPALILTATFMIGLVQWPARAQQVETAPSTAAAKASLPALTTEVAFPNLKIDRPVVLAYPEDGSNLLFVVEQHKATIYSFPNEKNTKDKDKLEFL